MPSFEGVVGDAAPIRLDRYVAETLGLLTRSQVKARGLRALVNGKARKVSRLVEPGDLLRLEWDDAAPSELEPEDLPLSVIYEDERVVVVDKAQGMVVHPGAGNPRGTLANALLHRRLARGAAGSGLRPGIVHRLDKDTSGVMIAAYDDDALAFLSEQFKSRSTKKTYVALVKGRPPQDKGRIETLIARDPRDRKRFACSEKAGKHALTLYRVARSYEGYSLLLVRIKTGRTHQIRVHLRHLGCPIVGDPVYSRPDPRFPGATLMLHALRLGVRLPGAEAPSVFTAPLPDRFRVLLRRLARSPRPPRPSRPGSRSSS